MPTLPSQPRAPLSWPASKGASGKSGSRTECSMSASPYPKPPEIQRPVQGVAYGTAGAMGAAFIGISAATAGAEKAATAESAKSSFFILEYPNDRPELCGDHSWIRENCCYRHVTLKPKVCQIRRCNAASKGV